MRNTSFGAGSPPRSPTVFKKEIMTPFNGKHKISKGSPWESTIPFCRPPNAIHDKNSIPGSIIHSFLKYPLWKSIPLTQNNSMP